MSDLVHMRQRIKSIETIKKITQAMRLISMSSHSRLKHRHEAMMHYVQAIETLFVKLYKEYPDWDNSLHCIPSVATPNPLYIIIGSQKGLCGTFNTNLFHFFLQQTTPTHSYNVIAVGKKAIEFVEKQPSAHIVNTHPQFTIRTLFTIAQSLSTAILTTPPIYTEVTIFANELKGFFSQKPYKIKLLPFAAETSDSVTSQHTQEEYIWEDIPFKTLTLIAEQYLDASVQSSLLQSLLAEHAARFVSMDGATRSAEHLLDSTKLSYNKLRQAKITKELSELSGSF